MLLTSKIKITNHKHRQRHKTCTTVGEGTAHVSSRHTSGQSYEHEPHNVTKRPACLTHFSIRLLRSVYYKRLSCASKLVTRQLAVPISPSDSARRSKVSPYTVWLTPKLVLTPCHLKKWSTEIVAGRQTWQRISYYLTHATYIMWGDVLDARRLQSNREAWSKRSTAGLPADIEDQAAAVPCISPRNIYQRQLMLLPSFKSACNCLLPFSHARQALNRSLHYKESP